MSINIKYNVGYENMYSFLFVIHVMGENKKKMWIQLLVNWRQLTKFVGNFNNLIGSMYSPNDSFDVQCIYCSKRSQCK